MAQVSASTSQSVMNLGRSVSFSVLPVEIRNEIWKLVHANIGGRIVTLYYNVKSGFSSRTFAPATLSINQESRSQAQKYFTPAFSSHHPFDTEFNVGFFDCSPVHGLTPIYVNFSKDIICLQEAQGDDVTIALEAMSSEDRQSIRRLSVNADVDSWYPVRACMVDQRDALESMEKLECLFTIRIDAWLVWCSVTEYEMKHILLWSSNKQRIRQSWRWDPTPRPLLVRVSKVPSGVHVGQADLLPMEGVHRERADRNWLPRVYVPGRRHLLHADDDGKVPMSTSNGYWITQVADENLEQVMDREGRQEGSGQYEEASLSSVIEEY